MYKCYHCGAVFLYPTLVECHMDHVEVDSRRREEWVEMRCPECGGEELAEEYACEACGEHLRHGMSEFCIDCIQKIDEVMDAALVKLMDTFECDKDKALEMIWDYHERNY